MHICRCFSTSVQMKYSHWSKDIFLLVLLAFFTMSLGSCKKDDEEEEALPMMTGDLLYDIPV